MPWRQYDWECGECGDRRADLVWVDHGKDPPSQAELRCEYCFAEFEETPHTRLISAPAVYTYDRPYAPMVSGGKFDTMGQRELPKLPPLPSDCAFDQVKDRFHSKANQEALKERHARVQENAAKRERAKRIQAGEPGNDLRTNPLPGDPKIEKVAGKLGRRKVMSA
jgi:hypothetical protein